MKKRILMTVLCICIVIGTVGVPVAQARWTNCSSISLNMQLSSGTVTSEAQVAGKTGTTQISLTFTLEKLINGKYTYVDSWQTSSNSIICSSSHKTYSCTGGTYKLTIVGTVTIGGYAEPIDDWFIKTL